MEFLILYVFSKRQKIKQLLGDSRQQIKGKKKKLLKVAFTRTKYKDIILHNKNNKTESLSWHTKCPLSSGTCLNDFLWEDVHLKQAEGSM